MESNLKVTIIHLIFALLASIISTSLSLGWFGFTNDVFAGILAFVILYFVGQLSQKLYADYYEGFTSWLWNGIVPFLFIWIIVFTILFNYL